MLTRVIAVLIPLIFVAGCALLDPTTEQGTDDNAARVTAQIVIVTPATLPSTEDSRMVHPELDGEAVRHYRQGNSFIDEGDWRNARSEFDQAIALEPEYAMAYYDRGYVRGRLGDHLGAIADLSIAIEADAGQISDFYRANAYIDRSNALLYSGRFEEATADCSRAVELFSEPEDKARAYHNRGAVQRFQGNLSEALPDYDRAVDLSPGNAVLLFDRGQLQVELGNLEAAISDFNAVLRIPTSLELQMEAHTHRGKIMIDLGRMKEALADYDAAVKLQPENYSARLMRGALLAEQGMVEEALEDLEMVAASISNAKEVELAAQLVQRLRSAD